ncbi:MAG: putative esterase [Myxococcota bacterium]|jgi:predicted esterase
MRPSIRRILCCVSVLCVVLGAAACDDVAVVNDDDTVVADSTVDSGVDSAEADVTDTVDNSPGLGIDYGSTDLGATPRYAPSDADWMAVGWPSDRYIDASGFIDLSRFPTNGSALVESYVALGEVSMDGFGLNSAVYIEFDRVIDVSTLPEAAATQPDTAVIQLVNVTSGSPAYDMRMPLLFRFYEGGDDPFYRPLTLAMRPVYGFPLREGDTYCAVVTRAVQDADGNYLQAAPGFLEALTTAPDLAPLGAWMTDSPLRESDLAAATCFRAHHATGELQAISDYIDVADPPSVDAVSEPVVYNEFFGTYSAPNFQAGEKPYLSVGGQIELDADGEPIVQSTEEIRYLLLVPRDVEMPVAGWPLVIYSHGTGGDYTSCRSIERDILGASMAMLCTDQPLHGSRGDVDGASLDLASFNFLNPFAGRSNFRQAAIDTLIQSRMVASGAFDIEARATRIGKEVRFDPARILFFGHSHGGLSGSLALAFDKRISGAVISGMAGILVETVLRRKDPLNFFQLVTGVLQVKAADFDTFHPAASLIQMLVDATDPLNYAVYWLDPPAGTPSKHVFVTQGTLDAASPSVGNDAATGAAGVPLIGPLAKRSPAHVLHGLEVETLSVTGNVTGSDDVVRTAAVKQWQGGSHFVAFNNSEARALWRGFLSTLATETGPPTISTNGVSLTQPTTVGAARACEGVRLVDGTTLPVSIRGNTSLASAQLNSGGCGDEKLGAVGRDAIVGLSTKTAGTYRIRLSVPPAIDKDTDRLAPDVLYVTRDCNAVGNGCLGQRVGAGVIDVELGADEVLYAVVDGQTADDVGPFTVTFEQRCEVLACDDRVCGAWGCGDCGACQDGQRCTDMGQCKGIATGDSCADPRVIDGLPFEDSVDSSNFTNQHGVLGTDCPGWPFTYGTGSNDVVYRFTAPVAGVYTAVLGGDFDGLLYVTADCSAMATGCRTALRNPFGAERVTFEASANETLFVVADGAANGASNSRGPLTLRVDACVPNCEGRGCGDDGCGGRCGSCAPGNSCVEESICEPIEAICDDVSECEDIPGNVCAGAIPIDSIPFSDTQDTKDFEANYGYAGGWCPGETSTRGFGARDVTYAFSAEEAGLYRFRLDTGIFDANLYLVEDCDNIAQTCLAADDRDENERIWRDFAAGESAFVVVDGWTNFTDLSGRYTLDVIQCRPSCDGRACGGDGCIGSCGTCDRGEACIGFACMPAPGLSCDVSRTIGAIPYRNDANTSSFADSAATGCVAGFDGAGTNDVTYRFTAPFAGSFHFSVESTWAAQVSVIATCDPTIRSCLAGGVGATDAVLEEGQTVFVVVDGAELGAGGAFRFRVDRTCFPQCEGRTCGADACGGVCGSCAAPADICTGDGLCLNPGSVTGNTCESPFDLALVEVGQTVSGGGDTGRHYNHYTVDAGQCGGDAGEGFVAKGHASGDSAYRITRPGRYAVTVTPEGWDAVVYAVTDCGDIAQNCLTLDDGQLSESIVVTVGDTPVYIIVDGADDVQNDAGAYAISVTALE